MTRNGSIENFSLKPSNIEVAETVAETALKPKGSEQEEDHWALMERIEDERYHDASGEDKDMPEVVVQPATLKTFHDPVLSQHFCSAQVLE